MVVACALAMAAATLFVAPASRTYESTALVIARELNVERSVLPRLGSAVFGSGAVANAVVADPALGGDAEDLIPDRLSLVAAEDSIVFIVQGRDSAPTDAARLANVAATAFVEQLNRGGAGIGEFALQAEAVVPSQPLSTLSTKLRVLVGGFAGILLGLGLVALVAAVRRPVVTSGDVERAVAVPVLGSMQLPAVTRRDSGPLRAHGLATVARWLAALPPGRLVLISPRSATGIRQRVYVLLTVALWTLRPVRLEAAPPVIEAAEQHRLEVVRAGSAVRSRGTARDALVVVDGGSPIEIVDPARTTLSVVVIVPRGLSQRRLRRLTLDYQGQELVGVVLVDVRRRLPGSTTQRPRAKARRPATTGATVGRHADEGREDAPAAERR